MTKLADWMRANGKNQKQLARETGISRPYVNLVYHGKEQPGDAFLWRFYTQYGQDAVCAAFDTDKATA